tara:strand:+ start:771 stop:893 length:123 start_codon:yes stop_codon:yes gene_type:complete
MLVGVSMILGGIGFVDVSTILYVCGIIFIVAGIGEMMIGE